MTTITLSLNQEELRHFEALMKLRRHPPGFRQHKNCSYYYIPTAASVLKQPQALQLIHLYDYTEERQIIAELRAHGIPFKKTTT